MDSPVFKVHDVGDEDTDAHVPITSAVQLLKRILRTGDCQLVNPAQALTHCMDAQAPSERYVT